MFGEHLFSLPLPSPGQQARVLQRLRIGVEASAGSTGWPQRQEAYGGMEPKQGQGSPSIGVLSRGESGPQEGEAGCEVWEQAGTWCWN